MKNLSSLYLALVVGIWALNPLILQGLSGAMSPFAITFYVTFFALVFFVIVITAKRRWGEFRSYSKGDFLLMFCLGFFCIAPYTILYYIAFMLAPDAAGEINIINYLWPLWTVILSSIVMRERLTARKALSVLLGFTGVYLIITGGKFVSLKADAIPAYASAFAGSFFWGLFSALSKKKNYPALTSMAVYKASAFLGFSLAFLLSGSLVLPSLGHLPAIVLLGFVVNGLAYLLWIMALSAGDTAWVSSGVYATPVVALLYLALAGRSSLKLYHLIGLFFVLSGPLFILRQKRERRRT